MCDLYFEDPIFYVEYVSKFNENKNMLYIFVGVVEDKIEQILKKLENPRETVKSDELTLLKTKYKNDYAYWKDLRTKKEKFTFINSHIMYDDSLNEFKRKIFVYCSNVENQTYFLPQNMELWVVDNNNKTHMLGYKYKDMIPHINEKVEIGKEYSYDMYTNEVVINMERNSNKRIIETSDNYTLLYDLLKNIQLKKNMYKIYLSDAYNEYKELIKSVEYSKYDKNDLKNKYLKNYFPVATYDMDVSKMKSTYLIAKDDSQYNDFIIDNLFHYPIDESLFESCYFNNFVLNVNNLDYIKSDEINLFSGGGIQVKLDKKKKSINSLSKSKSNMSTINKDRIVNVNNQKVELTKNVNNQKVELTKNVNNQKVELTKSLVKEMNDYDFVDLYQIFEYLRSKKIGKKIPFIKYNDIGFSNPFILISKSSVDQNLLNKPLLSQWSDNQGKKFYGLQVKRYIKDLISKDNKKNVTSIPLFSTLQLYKYGRIQMSVAFKSEHKARFQEIYETINNCSEFIDDLNKNIIDYRISRSIDINKKIIKPTCRLDKNEGLILSSNCTIAYMNYFIEYKNGEQIDLKDLYEFCKLFPSFISLNPNKSAGLNSIQIRYNRVSGFANLDEIMEKIYNLKEKNIKDGLIIKFLEKEFGKSTEECKKYLLEYKKKYSHIQSSSEDSKNKLGFVIQITKNNITIRGVRNMRHIYDTYRFLCLFMTLYLNKDTLKSNPIFKRLLFSRDPGASENASLQFQGLTEVTQNFTFEDLDLNINMGDEVTLDVGITEILNGEKDEKEESNIINSMSSNSGSLELKVGNRVLAANEEISTDVQLSCDDAIPEIDTCEDFCNDAKYFIRQLQRHDKKLFFDKREKLKGKVKYEKYTKYSKSCQKIRQPVVLSYNPEDGLSIDTKMEIKRNSYTYSIKYGSDPDRPNWYICPEVWCPRCRIPIPIEDVDQTTIRKRKTAGSGGTCVVGICPFSSTSPYGEHQVFIRGKKDPYPGFQDTKTEDGFCLPCCFGKRQDDPKYSSYKTFQKCLGVNVNEGNEEENIIYVLGKAIPLDRNRFGILHPRIEMVLNSNIPTGYLGYQKGYLRRGIKHENHNSFLSAIANIFSCDQENVRSVDNIKEYIVNKIDEKLFRSLYGGNLINVFYDPHKNITPLQNYKNYILSKNIDIDHTYLWDLIQRPRIISENGINLFIFEDNMLCPVGENVTEFYDKSKKTIILAKYKQYYEPIYYLEGNGKQALIQCVFDNNKKEIEKLFEIAYDGCKPYNKIDWKSVVFNSLMKPNIVKENIVIDYGISLNETLKELLTAIKINKKLDKSFMPKTQYIDISNKVIGLLLENGLFIPVSPSKLIVDIDQLGYVVIEDYKDISLLNIEKTIKYMEEISKVTKIPVKPIGYISDSKDEYIVGIVTEKDRIICVERIKNNVKIKLKRMDNKFYTDIDMFIHNNVKLVDDRIIFMNKRKYEDETYTRIRFEIARYLQEHNNIRNKIYKVINGNEKDIHKKREEINSIINPIFDELVSIMPNNVDFDFYEKPNQRMPCRLRSVNKKKSKENIQEKNGSNNSNKNSEIIFSCDEDPHCVSINNSCKLNMNEYNLLDTHKKNINIYLPMLVEEIVRFLLKRNEILDDGIPSIINREDIKENPYKYYIIHTIDPLEILKKIDNIFLDKEGLYLDKRPLFDTITTSEYVLPQGKYALVNASKLLNNMNEIPEIWSKLLGYNFVLILHHSKTKLLFNIFDLLINEIKSKNNSNINKNFGNNINSLNIQKIKEMMINFMENPTNKLLINKIINKIKNNLEISFNHHLSNSELSNSELSNSELSNKSTSKSSYSKSEDQRSYMVEMYKKIEPKVFRNVNDFSSLKHKILSDEYEGNDLDIGILSHIFKINFLILNKKRKDASNKALLYGNEGTDFYTDYVMLLRNNNIDNFKYQWFQLKNKGLIHKLKDYNEKFIREVIEKV